MRKLVFCVLAMSALLTPAAPATAADPAFYFGPAENGPSGALCGFTSYTDPGSEDGIQTGEVNGGPLLGTGTLFCTIQVGSEPHGDASNDATEVAEAGSGTIVILPTVVSYPAYPNVPVYLCTRFLDSAGVTRYWDAAAKQWTSDAGSSCALAVQTSTEDPAFYAVTQFVLRESGSTSNGSGVLYADCGAGPGVAWTLNHGTYAVTTSAQSVAPAGAQGAGITVRCWIRQPSTGQQWCCADGFGTGSAAFGATVLDVDAREGGRLILCVDAWALFTGGYPPLHYRTPECP